MVIKMRKIATKHLPLNKEDSADNLEILVSYLTLFGQI